MKKFKISILVRIDKDKDFVLKSWETSFIEKDQKEWNEEVLTEGCWTDISTVYDMIALFTNNPLEKKKTFLNRLPGEDLSRRFPDAVTAAGLHDIVAERLFDAFDSFERLDDERVENLLVLEDNSSALYIKVEMA